MVSIDRLWGMSCGILEHALQLQENELQRGVHDDSGGSETDYKTTRAIHENSTSRIIERDCDCSDVSTSQVFSQLINNNAKPMHQPASQRISEFLEGPLCAKAYMLLRVMKA